MKIYKIIDNTNGNVYIGKTEKTLNDRLSNHKFDKTCMSREIIKNGDYKIELIEETEDESRERYWILNTECVNITIPGRTQKEYYLDNKDKIDEYQKEYNAKNKEHKRNYDRMRSIWMSSMGGDPRHNNNLLKIDPNLFLL